MGEPVCRASYFNGNVEAIDVLGDAPAAQVRVRAGLAIDAITQAPRTAWVSFAHDLALNRAIADVAGVDGVIAVNERSLIASSEGPLLRPFLDGAIRLFGVSPTAILKMAPRVWGAVTKDAGHLRIEPLGPSALALWHEDIPPVIAADDTYHRGLEGIVRGIFALTHVNGTTRYERISPTSVRIVAEWTRG